MSVNHRAMSLVFALGIGLLVSFCSYQWITDDQRGAQRAVEEAVVRESRLILESYVGRSAEIEISDPLNRVRAAGKVYIYPTGAGWEVSGQYRRVGERRWNAYLMTLDSESRLVSLSVEDASPELAGIAAADPKFSVSGSR
jgi:hypothetical protein